ncbi:MAG: LamG domain-containing protein [Sedimentisphaerales bacterium]|nr:LamG domain-containing protein [Sedimentisphaerales bacterium]
MWSFTTQIGGFDPDLVSWWKFDEASGTVAYDSAGDNDGQLIGGPTWTTGHIDGALDFDGVNDYVEMGDTVKNHLGMDYTVSAWIKADTLTGNHQIAAYRDSKSHNDPPPLLFQLHQAEAHVQFIVTDNYEHQVTATYTNALTAGAWYHIAGVRSGNTLNVYVNGQSGMPGSGTLTGTISSDNLKIGALLCSGAPVTSFFDGVIDDVRIYSRALSAEEVWQLYQSGL